MTLTNGHENDVALVLAVADEDIPPEVFSDKAGRKRWDKQGVLLETYAHSGKEMAGCLAAGVNIRTHNRWLEENRYGYHERFQLANKVYVGLMEAEADRRAIEGIDHPVIHQGKITATYKQYSDNLLMFRMKKLDPAYRDNYTLTLEVPDDLRAWLQQKQMADQEARAALPESKGIVVDPDGALLNDAPPPWETE